MREAPFDVTIRVDSMPRGVYQHHPLANGSVAGPDGAMIDVAIGIDEPAPRPGKAKPRQDTMQFSVHIGTQAYRLDVTDLLERIARQALQPPDVKLVTDE